MVDKNNSLFCNIIGSITMGIISTTLYILGYFPGIVSTLLIALFTAFIMIIYTIFDNVFNHTTYINKQKMKLLPSLLVGIFGTISSTGLALATFLNNKAQSTLVLVFLSATFFTFMCCYYIKIILSPPICK